MDIAAWVREARSYADITQQRLADALTPKRTKGSISQIEKGFAQASVKLLQNISEITRYPMPGELQDAQQMVDDRYVTLQQLDTGGAMGRGVELNEFTGVIANWQVSHEWAAKNLPAHTGLKNLKIVTGFGDSMRGVFEPGDPLIVDAGVKECASDGMYFYRVGNEAFIKRLQRIPTAGGIVYRVLSENAAYPPYDIAVGMEIEILAKVIKVWRSTVF
jgi:phage repressor protein C with HTH and peptisase S24 domain